MLATPEERQARPAPVQRPASGISVDPGRLAWWRESRGWSRQQLSREIARLHLTDEETGEPVTVSRDAIAKHENGERRPKPSTVRAYCAVLSTPDHPCIPRDLLPGGEPLTPHEDAEARKHRLRHNKALRKFARAHGIRYKNPVSGRVYYSRPLRAAFELSISDASDEDVAAAVAAAVAAIAPSEPEDESLRRLDLDERDSIAELDLSVRAHNTLIRNCIRTIGDLAGHTAGDLTDFRDFGSAALAEVREKLASAGFALRNDEPAGREPSQDPELLAS